MSSAAVAPKRLAREFGLPRREGDLNFQLRKQKVGIAGRPGWMVDDLLAEIRDDPQTSGTILMIHHADDDALSALYDGAAFCLYPSVYEGYGLPIIEAFAHGKAVLASAGGALPELVEGFSPCLDPADEQVWYETLRQWIQSPQARAAYERAIRERFRHPTWSEAAAGFFGAIAASVPGMRHLDDVAPRKAEASST